MKTTAFALSTFLVGANAQSFRPAFERVNELGNMPSNPGPAPGWESPAEHINIRKCRGRIEKVEGGEVKPKCVLFGDWYEKPNWFIDWLHKNGHKFDSNFEMLIWTKLGENGASCEKWTWSHCYERDIFTTEEAKEPTFQTWDRHQVAWLPFDKWHDD